MGRRSYDKKDLVGDQISISIMKFKELGYLTQGYRYGMLTWSRSDTQIGSVCMSLKIQGQMGTMRLNYTYEKTESLNYEVRLVTTPCNYGGFRWWFVCPLFKSNTPCQKRVAVLYLAGKYAGCRDCYNLTYKSCQNSHKFDAFARRMGLPDEKALNQLFKRESF